MTWFPHVQAAVDLICREFGIAGTTYPGHDDGLHDGNRAAPLGQLACDFWPHGAPADQAEEIRVMNWVFNNRARLNVRYVVGNGQKVKNIDRADTTDGPWRQMEFIPGPRYTTNNHLDHVHVTFLPVWALSDPGWAGPVTTTSGVLREGATGAPVAVLQSKLTLLGYRLIPDGEFGPKTTAAVRDFQLRHHLAADGAVGPQTWAALAVALAAIPPPNPFAGFPVLRAGATGAQVVVWQKALNALHATPQLALDGFYGTLTTSRTADFQRLAGLTVDGVAGLKTYAAAAHFLALARVTI